MLQTDDTFRDAVCGETKFECCLIHDFIV